jgi:hypothetical protein
MPLNKAQKRVKARATREARKRGGILRTRTISFDGKYAHVAIVPKAGPKGGHTVMGPIHKKKKERR